MRRDCLFSEIPTFSIIMENYVNQLLKDADLAVVTKKHVRMKYKEHIGRELNHEEKSKINDMVYAFVKELSAASNQISSEPEPTEKTPISNEESPGNKENKQTNHKANTFIIKGQVVDRNDLYKSSSKKKPDKSPHEKEKQKMEETKVKGETPEQTKDRIHKQKAAAAKLKINEVMSAVLVKTKTKARRSLKMESKSEKSKSKNIQDDSDNLSDDNDLSSIENDKTKKKLTRNGLKANDSRKKAKVKPNSDSDELTLKKTPQKYGKGKTLISDKETANHSEKRRKIVKRKRKVIVDDSDTESDTGMKMIWKIKK
ncbi:uncharacterized protein LOC132730218 [Ruditapes philippinarum]|uniref:uncharacterized protein LOC132730218 n=1 Tax=Ruditapes philippinarum TaxID=129788 RepID=UPI00295A993C|nr:uncharacterized protein LOC132730218 [Ruditapes philippinarum]